MSREPSETEAQPPEAAEKKADTGLTKKIVTGAAIGIGSAALVAALLYANRSTKAKKPPRA
jgi:hypothetical protein